MIETLETLADVFHEGGWGMYPIAIVAMFVIAIGVERISYLCFKSRINKDNFVNSMHKYLYQGNLQRAITYCSSNRDPLANIVKAGLLRVDGTEEEIKSAMETVSLQELPRIEKRTGYLAMLSNSAVLLGLLGTISGLIKAFAAVSMVDTADKATVLAQGISEAMNCTAFGLGTAIPTLGTAIPTLVLFSLLSGTTQHLIDDINESRTRMLNLLLENREKLCVADVQGEG
jgi:biopolymer transport protein ExbB/TolQ